MRGGEGAPKKRPAIFLVQWLLAMIVLTYGGGARADILRWDNNQLVAGTAGITPGPGIDLSGWNSTGHNLEYANFAYNLTGASFANSDLSYALFPASSTLANANFSGAIITGANLKCSTANDFTSTQLYSTASYINRNLAGVSFSGSNQGNAALFNWNFANQDLSNANFTNAATNGAIFTNAIIKGANFSGSGTPLKSSMLYSTSSYTAGDLSGINFSSNALNTGLNLVNQNLTGANFSATDLSGDTVTGANLTNAVVTQANFSSVTGLTAAQIYSTANYTAGNLTKVSFGSDNLSGWSFSGISLAGTSFSAATLTGADFSNAVIHGDTRFKATSFSGTTVKGFTAAQLYSTASYSAKNLSGVNLSNNNLTGWDFSGQNVYDANFSNTTSSGFTTGQLYSTSSYISGTLYVNLSSNDLSGWDLSGKNVAGCVFAGSNLTATNFTGASVKGVMLAPAIGNTTSFSNTTSRGFTAAQLYSTSSYGEKDLSWMDFSSNDLSGWHFANQNLSSDNFSNSVLTGADFTDSFLSPSSAITLTQRSSYTLSNGGLTAAQLYSSASYKNKDLANFSLSPGASGLGNVRGWNFAGLNMARDSFSSLDFTNANCGGASFTNAAFNNCVFAGDFHGADFTHANIVGQSNFVGAFFAGANFTNVSWVPSTLDVHDGDLRGAINWPGNISEVNYIDVNGSLVISFHPGEMLIIRNYPMVITMALAAQFNATSDLQIMVDSNWGSTIHLDTNHITPSLNGTLDLEVAPGVDPATLVGTTFQVFVWNAPLAGSNHFATIVSSPGLTFDTSNLYTNGTVTLTSAVPVPEAGSLGLLGAGVAALITRRRRHRNAHATALRRDVAVT